MEYDCWMLGERSPWVTNTKASKLRVMDALVRTESRMLGSCIDSGGQLMLYSLEVPVGSKEEFERIAKGTLTRHCDIQIGIVKSAKRVIYDVEGD